jgi:capsular polysaccharide export protein
MSPGIRKIPQLAELMGAEQIVYRPNPKAARTLDAIAGWGHKPSADGARALAAEVQRPYLALEDGFLRSVGLGDADPPLSLLLDDVGIYYDARSPSRLELLLGATEDDPLAVPGLLDRARALRRRIVDERLSKYNHTSFGLPASLTADSRPIALVVDQTFADASVPQGLAGAESFEQLLHLARQEHPDARIIIKTHPDVIAGRKRGYLTGKPLPDGIEVLAEAVNPIELLQRCQHLYCCTSQLGFEGLMVGVAVTCSGVPFYAGWGLTTDLQTAPRRKRTRSLDELVAAALILYPRYVDPLTGTPCEAERIVEHLALQRQHFAKNDRRFFCLGMPLWRRPFVRGYLRSPSADIRFCPDLPAARAAGLSAGATAVVWGINSPSGLKTELESLGVELWRMEDGFLRSVRLGSDLAAPGSLVVDAKGIYFDPTEPSELESTLEQGGFTAAELGRATALREFIVGAGISKYNAAPAGGFRPKARAGQRIVLVPGQVVDDASVRLGSPDVRDNEALLRAVRTARPDAHLVYKPHPDVLSGNRKGQVRSGSSLWDELVTDASIAECLAAADEVHTMTSLVGFEALLRGKQVVTYGSPFYAGWGLTEDRLTLPRRTRKLSVEELIVGTLLRYPRYVSWGAHCFCTAEDMVAELIRLRAVQHNISFRTPWLLRRARSIFRLAQEWVRAS